MLLLLDRDGVLNEDREESVRHPGELVMISGAAEAVARFNAAGHLVAVVTNQAVVGRGIIDNEMLDRIHDRLRGELARAGARLDALTICTDPPWAAGPRRKPAPGMLREMLVRFRANADEAVMIGDSLRDLEAAAALGIRRILVRTGKGALTQAKGLPANILPVSIYDNLSTAADELLAGR